MGEVGYNSVETGVYRGLARRGSGGLSDIAICLAFECSDGAAGSNGRSRMELISGLVNANLLKVGGKA
jgi:hypothetical protein